MSGGANELSIKPVCWNGLDVNELGEVIGRVGEGSPSPRAIDGTICSMALALPLGTAGVEASFSSKPLGAADGGLAALKSSLPLGATDGETGATASSLGVVFSLSDFLLRSWARVFGMIQT